MEANVPDRDELGRFTAWVKKKGGEAVDSIRKGAASSLQNIGKGANLAADAVAPVEAPDEAEDKEDASVTYAKASLNRMDAHAVDRNMKTGKEYTHPSGATDEMAKSHYDDASSFPPKGPAQKRKQGQWSMEKKRGW